MRVGILFKRIILSLVVAAALIAPAAAQSFNDWFFTPEPLDESFYGFGARVTVNDNLANGFEDNYILGAAYQRYFNPPGGFRFGVELGVAGRFGPRNSAELWGGVIGRYDFDIFDTVRISPSLAFGLSAVTAPLIGGEQDRETAQNGDARLLFYLGPEIAASLLDAPQHEVFIRLHHRSGAWGRLGNMQGGQDAIALGYRYQF